MKLIIFIFLFISSLGQKIVTGSKNVYLESILKLVTNPLHKHYFKITDLPKCNMRNGASCAAWHFKMDNCICGLPPRTWNVKATISVSNGGVKNVKFN